MIDDEIDRRAHFVITETPSTVLHTGPTHQESHGHVVAVVVLVVAASASALSPCPAGGERPDDRWAEGRGTQQIPPGGPRARTVLSRICIVLCIYAARLGRTYNTHSYANI